MSVLMCQGWACGRLISATDAPAANRMAAAEPEFWALDWSVCRDCRMPFCDRCVLLRQGGCADCTGELIDGRQDGSLRGVPRPAAVEHCARGKELGEAGRFEEALAELDRALGLRPVYPAAQFFKALVFIHLERPAEILDALTETVRQDPRHAEAWFNLGISLSGNGVPDKAVDAYTIAIEISPRYYDALVNRGILHMRLDRLPAALDDLGTAIRLAEADQAVSPNEIARHYAYAARGVALMESGRDEEALSDLDNAISTGPDNPDVYLNKAEALEHLGRTEEAGAAYRLYEDVLGQEEEWD
jgi:tetratricopeptide (TPR) repeat protein